MGIEIDSIGGRRRRAADRYAALGIPLADWLKFAVFIVSFYVSVRITQHQVDDLKISFQKTQDTIEQMRGEIVQLKLTNAVLVEEYNLEKQRRMNQELLDAKTVRPSLTR